MTGSGSRLVGSELVTNYIIGIFFGDEMRTDMDHLLAQRLVCLLLSFVIEVGTRICNLLIFFVFLFFVFYLFLVFPIYGVDHFVLYA